MKTEVSQIATITGIGARGMTSREIAEATNKHHFHVRRDIEKMLIELELDVSKYGCIYLDGMNRKQTEYVLDVDLTLTLMTGYSVKLRNAIIKRWRQLEAQNISLQERLNKICAKEDYDKAIGSIHGKGLAERKKTKRLNSYEMSEVLSQMQLSFNFSNSNKRGLL